jgi:hypothetical protein
MVMTTTPVTRKRCPLCLAILELSYVAGGAIATVRFEQHTPEKCEASTLQRIKVLEEIHLRDVRELESQSHAINDLGQMIGACSGIVNAGRKWLVHRAKRAVDLERLRNAFGTQDRANCNPLWDAEAEVALAIEIAIQLVAKRVTS